MKRRKIIFPAVIAAQLAGIGTQILLTLTYMPLAPCWLSPMLGCYRRWSQIELVEYFVLNAPFFFAFLAVILYVLFAFEHCRRWLWWSAFAAISTALALHAVNIFLPAPLWMKHLMWIPAIAQSLVAFKIIRLNRISNPIPPALFPLPALLSRQMFLYQYFAPYFFWYVLTISAQFAILVWLLSLRGEAIFRHRRLAYAFACICALVLLCWNIATPKKISYGYHIGFAEIQFGNINGDKYPDLFTCGYIGMSYGNPSWFAGRKDHFDDWNDMRGQRLRGIGQQTACLVDLDGDGDLDIVSGSFLINDAGKFNRSIDFGLFFSRERNFAIHAAPLTPGDDFSEVIFNQNGETVVSVCVGSYDWEAWRYSKNINLVIDRSMGNRPSLILFEQPPPRFADFLRKWKMKHRVVELEKKYSSMDADYLLKDFNSDGCMELALWARHGGENNWSAPTSSFVAVFKEKNGRFELLSSFTTEKFKINYYNGHYAYPEFKFADFDRDGKIDFIGDDGWIYRQTANFKFKKSARVNLLHSMEAIHLYACDINQDGYPDVISSYQPFTNIKMGPISLTGSSTK